MEVILCVKMIFNVLIFGRLCVDFSNVKLEGIVYCVNGVMVRFVWVIVSKFSRFGFLYEVW